MGEEVYKQNFLTNVVFKVDFPKILELETNKPSDFQKAILKNYPILNELQGQFIENAFNKKRFSTKIENRLKWEFFTKDKKKKILLDCECLTIEYFDNVYKHFDEFLEDIKFVFKNFFEIYSSIIIKRIGLRYVNQIKLASGNPLDWKGYLDNDLFSVVSNFAKEEDILKSMHLLDIKEDDFKLRFQYGIANSDYPNSIARKEFILDYDCFIVEEVDNSVIYNYAIKFNKIIEKWFEKSIKKSLREIMRTPKNE